MSEPRRRLKPEVVLLGIAALLNDASSEIIYPLLPVFLTTYFGATPMIVGMIEATADALASFLKLLSGTWSDKISRRKPFVVGGYLLAGFARMLVAVAAVWPVVFLARLLDRTGKGVRSAPRDAMICDVTPLEQRGHAFGFHRGLDHTGAVIGPLIAIVLLSVLHLSLRTVFFIAAIPAIAGAILLLVLLRETSGETELKTTRGLWNPAPLGRPFWRAIGSIALFSLANSSDVFLLLQASAAGVSTAFLPALWSAHHIVKSLFSSKAGALSDRVDRRFLLAAGWLSYAVIYLLFPFAKSLPFFLVLFILYAVPFTLTEGAERAWIGDKIGSEVRGKAYGVYYLTSGLLTLAGTVIFGALYQKVSAIAAFHTGAGFAMIAAISIAMQDEERRTPAAS